MDIRVIAATNVDPPEAVREGKLREDLFYRLNVFAIALPPLRDRKDDIPLLVAGVHQGIQRAQQPRPSPGCRDAAMQILERYDWPGNVRELRNVMERATIVAQGAFDRVGRSAAARPTRRAAAGAPARRRGLTPGTTVDEAERQLIEITLAAHRRQQDARRRNARHQPQDAAQQAQSHEGSRTQARHRSLPCA